MPTENQEQTVEAQGSEVQSPTNWEDLSDAELLGMDVSDLTFEEASETPQNVQEQEVEKEVKSEQEVEEDSEGKQEQGQEGSTEVDSLQAFLDTPIKVGGSEFKLDDLEQVKSLLQKGIGANKRMQELQPKLGMMEMLENNNLLDPAKLNFLIALSNNEPEAIRKLINESGVDSFELTTGDVASDWEPADHSVPESQMAIKEQFEQIEGSPHSQATIDAISKMDTASKEFIQSNPATIALLHSHQEQGIYAEMQGILEKERLLGNNPAIQGKSDAEAYSYIWSAIQENLASNPGMGEAVSKGSADGNEVQGNLAGSSDGNEAGHNVQQTRRSTAQQQAAQAAARSTSRGKGVSDPVATPIDLDSLSDDEIKNMSIDDILRGTQ